MIPPHPAGEESHVFLLVTNFHHMRSLPSGWALCSHVSRYGLLYCIYEFVD